MKSGRQRNLSLVFEFVGIWIGRLLHEVSGQMFDGRRTIPQQHTIRGLIILFLASIESSFCMMSFDATYSYLDYFV